jgi:hypothetical protein
MSNALIYLFVRFFYSIWGFIRHWYVDGFWAVAGKTLTILESFDRGLALRITLKNFFKPLYQDYTIPGFIFGLFFRTTRTVIALGAYFIVAVLAILVYVLWALLPFYILALGFQSKF